MKTAESDETIELVHEAGGQMVSLHPLDVSLEDEAKRWVEFAVQSYGDFDILYNNASRPHFGKITEMSAEDWHFTLRNELDIIVFTTKHAVSVMTRRGGGSIINTASVAGLVGLNLEGVWYEFAHAATKAGVIGLTRNIADELAPNNIRVNAISPGLIDTPALQNMPTDLYNSLKQMTLARQMIKRTGQAQDIAYCAVYLASDESSFVTGQNFIIDGGMTAL